MRLLRHKQLAAEMKPDPSRLRGSSLSWNRRPKTVNSARRGEPNTRVPITNTLLQRRKNKVAPVGFTSLAQRDGRFHKSILVFTENVWKEGQTNFEQSFSVTFNMGQSDFFSTHGARLSIGARGDTTRLMGFQVRKTNISVLKSSNPNGFQLVEI